MKKLTLFLLVLFALGLGFQACDNTKTYAEMLEEEKDGIKAFIKDSNIVVISQSQFYAQDSTTDVSKNEYVQLASGVYMQIVDKGYKNDKGELINPNDTVKSNDIVLVRFSEFDILQKRLSLSNLNAAETVDAFLYTVTSSSIAGLFKQGYMLSVYGSQVPAGWLVPLSYVGNGARVKLIVPSKMGQSTAMQQVWPYYYYIQKYQIY
ncbi:DUF4827 domain-containing protein [Bacteroides sp.]|uniref:DUF4827 domain-containing protein n=1 Tax=Bacteroides sp. TaxID=29523 RepID=UPI002614CF7E|nr:DUF4827 domain-containing protein [Bacteroides sp.]